MSDHVVLATRGSSLALWQAEAVRHLLRNARPERVVELAIVHASGDKDLVSDLQSFPTVGVFTAEIDRAVLAGRAHAGVHSLKDMTTTLEAGLVLAGTLARGDVEDVLVARDARSFAELPQGARVATGSRRRRAQLLRARPDLTIVELRGNVETRLAKIERGDAEAALFARAGLKRLGLADRACEVMPLEQFVPAVGQGIVGIVCREDDDATRRALAAITDRDAWAAAHAERSFLRRLQGGCSSPVGGHARVAGEALALVGQVLAVDGSAVLEERIGGAAADAELLGVRLAERLLERGAGELLAAARGR